MKEHKRIQVHTGRDDFKKLPGTNAGRLHLNWDIEAPYVPWKKGNFNPAFMPWLEKQVEAANAKGMTAVIVLDGTPKLRRPHFDRHALNVDNGGVIDYGGKKSAVTQYYQSDKVRNIIKGLLDGISGKLHGLNIEIFVMWETNMSWRDGGKMYNSEIIRHWCRFDNRRIGTGNPDCAQANELRDMLSVYNIVPRFYVEAWPYKVWRKKNAGYLNNPASPKLDVQFAGCWPHEILTWENRKKTAERQAYFTPGMETINAIIQLTDVVKMFIAGVGPCGHFEVFTKTEYWKRNYNIDISRYDMTRHQKIVNDFFTLTAVKKVVDNPELLESAAGRTDFIRACQKYKLKILGE